MEKVVCYAIILHIMATEDRGWLLEVKESRNDGVKVCGVSQALLYGLKRILIACHTLPTEGSNALFCAAREYMGDR